MIETVQLFPILDGCLIEVLRSLTPEEWDYPATPKWRVKDVTGHLLDSNLRRLSIARDHYLGESFPGGSLTDFLNGLNADWVRAMRRISPTILVELLESSNFQLFKHFQTLDPRGVATFGVSWAGEEKSENWFDIAREYTEKWHHQQQIREATGRESIMTRELYAPVLSTFMLALPFGYRNIAARIGAEVSLRVTGAAGGEWRLRKGQTGWALCDSLEREPDAQLTIPQEIAWKVFTKGISPELASASATIAGRRELALHALEVLAIVG